MGDRAAIVTGASSGIGLADEMIRIEGIADGVRFVLEASPNCVIPEIVFQRPGERL